MEINPETTELKNMVQNLSDLVVQVSKDVNRELSQMRGERLERRITDVFKWMVGMMVPVWISIIVLIITQFIKG
jgi:hypothetical protein